MDYQEGDLVWFDAGLGHPLPGEIHEVHRAAQVIVVQAVINGKTQTFTLASGEGSLQRRQDLGSIGIEDMTQLTDLHEASLLWNIRLRYDRNLIYTFAGSILIAVNPYKMIPNSYGLEVAKQYIGKPLGALPPHLFAISSAALASLPIPQAVVISGESGSGKTESTKLVMQYLAAVVPGDGSKSSLITEQILEAAPLLEAFGNARTVKNDNSSRFGKYLEVYFKGNHIVGAKITQYLLEKSRIVTQAQGERNYHVFYELLAGLSDSEKTKYGLLDAEKYFYLNQGSTDCTAGRVDWSSLLGAMQVLGVTDIERDGIVKVLASVLHLGNIYFHRRQLKHGQEGVEIGSDAEIKWTGHLLQISAEDLQLCLTMRITETRTERLHTPLGIDQALDARDAFAKTLYSALFYWLVSRINSIVHKGGTFDAHRISILDIFGFEDLEENSFEQLCINYANENLHLYFNKHIFKLEQTEYAKERLEWTPLTWEDNLPVIHLLAKKPVGIFHLLDDESNFPRASDSSFLEKCHYNHALNELYFRPRVGAQEFGIRHYAGQVWYCAEGFLEKNRDAIRHDVIELLSSSKEPLLIEMTKQMRAQRDLGKTMPRGANGRFVTMKPRTPTVAARFSDSLQQLLQSMAKCNPWFVRCIKPNNDKLPMKMDMPYVLTQLRYLGMLDTIKIRQIGYPVRLKFQHFVERYKHMFKKPLPRGTPYRELCRSVLEILPHTVATGPDYQLGATRVFLREALHRMLENSRADCQKKAAVTIQKHVRGMLLRKKLHRQNLAAIKIQSIWKKHQHHKKYKNLRSATIKAQSIYRGRLQRKRFAKMKKDLEKRKAMEKRKEMEKLKTEIIPQKIVKEQHEYSTIVQLDIPAELAFIFSKMEGWSPTFGDQHLVKIVGTVPGPPKTGEMSPDIDQFAFGKFSSVYCNGVKLSPRREPILQPFLSRAAARDHDFQDSLAVFKLILRWTGDTSLDASKEKILADYIAYKGLSSRSLRDEILVQLCNQVYKADDTHSIKIWQLMSHCLSSFQPGSAFSKYLIKFVKDNAPPSIRQIILKKLLRNVATHNTTACRSFPPTWLEWRATTRLTDIAISLTLPDGIQQTIAIDSWTTCEEAAGLAVSSLNISSQGWTVVLDDSNLLTESCGLDYVLDLVAEKELCPAFPTSKSDLLRSGRRNSKIISSEPSTLRRPQVPPPEPPLAVKTYKMAEIPLMSTPIADLKESKEENILENLIEYSPKFESAPRKTSHDLLSRNSALNERYFEAEKNRSRSLDDLLTDDSNEIIPPDPKIKPHGLSDSRLNDRYHSSDQIPPNISKDPMPRYVKSQYAGKRSAGSHSSKYMDKSDYGGFRSSAMSDTSEAPSLASHVRRVRVPSQASDVDQFLDELFSPVLDGSLDELSDARSLAASIRGDSNYIQSNEMDKSDFFEAPTIDSELSDLQNPILMSQALKGGDRSDGQEHLDDEVAAITERDERSLDEYITNLFQPIFINDSLKKLTEKNELVGAIKGGGTNTVTSAALSSSSGLSMSPINAHLLAQSQSIPINMEGIPPDVDPMLYHQQMQRAFLQSAMAQNLQIQQHLLAQNQALQTLLSRDPSSPTSPKSPTMQFTGISPVVRKQSLKNHPSSSPFAEINSRNSYMEMGDSKIPPPPPLPPLQDFRDPSEVRPFLDPYGRAKTVRIGKWRWPPPQESPQNENDEDFILFKFRQNQRKTTPQSQSFPGESPNEQTVEWEEFEVEQTSKVSQNSPARSSKSQEIVTSTHVVTKSGRRSFDIGADRPAPGSVGKLKLSSDMRQRLEQVTAGHSVRSSTSTKSTQNIVKLEETRKLLLEQQLAGSLLSKTQASPSPQALRMDPSKRPPPPPWPAVLPPAPPGPAPPPPIAPPTIAPPLPPTPIVSSNTTTTDSKKKELPAFRQRQEWDTFGVKKNSGNTKEEVKTIYDSWGRVEISKRDTEYNQGYQMDYQGDRERSRSRSRDRENFSESVWDRYEVEGHFSSESEREKEKDSDKHYNKSHNERDSEHYNSNYQHMSHSEKERTLERTKQKPSLSNMSQERATFKSHMVSKSLQERERKSSVVSAFASTSSIEKKEETSLDSNQDQFGPPVIPPPVLAPPSLKSPTAACLTYSKVPWKLRVRKEVFRPNEKLEPNALDLLFSQITSDIFGSTPCIRISDKDRHAALQLLSNHGLNADNLKSHVRVLVKRNLLELAKEWPLYFARLFIVNGSPQLSEISVLAIGHKGVYLVKRESDNLSVIKAISYSDLQGAVTLPRPAALQLNFKNGDRLILHASRATSIQTMVHNFCMEFNQVQSKSSSVSSGAKTTLTQNLNIAIDGMEHTNNAMISPKSDSTHNDISYNNSHIDMENDIINESHISYASKGMNSNHIHENSMITKENIIEPISSIQHESPTHIIHKTEQVNSKYSLLQFAMQHFRKEGNEDSNAKSMGRTEKRISGSSNQLNTDLVKWQGTSLRSPLLRLPSDLVSFALECFDCILRYCGDLPLDSDLTEVKCVYTVLMHCHKHLALRDEIYCQLMKQTTANKSECVDSAQRAWRLLSILTAYFGCSDALQPYLMEHLSSAASDRRKSCYGTAAVCLSNLRKTARCGGRKNVPSVEEVTAVSAGRSARRQIYRLPGGAERVVNTRCSTVVADVISELCALLGIDSVSEQQEFSLYCIVQGDAFTMPLAADEYILDVTTELLKSGQPFYLIFCRSVWHYPLKRDPIPSPLYIEVLFNQVAPDYLEGLLLELPSGGPPAPEIVRDMARIAAVLHRAADLNHVPAMKEIKFLLPKPALGIREIRPAQWVALVQSTWPTVAGMNPMQVKAQFLNILSTWPLFGSSFFAVKRVITEENSIDEPNQMWKELILSLNRKGILFLDPNTHEALHNWAFAEVISTRKVRSEDGALFLDLKVGNLMQQRVIRVQTEQAHEISRLVRQYITMAQAQQRSRHE